jgi:hypothetical protein
MPIIGSSRAVPQKGFYDPAAEALALLSGCTPENIDEDPYDSDSIDDVPTEPNDMNQDSNVSAKEGTEESTSSDAVTEPAASKSSKTPKSLCFSPFPHDICVPDGTFSNSLTRSVVLDSTINRISTRRSPDCLSNDDTKLSLRKSSRISKSSSDSSLSPAIKNNTTRSDAILSTRLRSRSSKDNTAETVMSKLRLRNSKSSSKEGIQQSESDKSNFEARFQDLVKYQKENGRCLNTAESVISKLRLRNSKSSSKEETQQSEPDKSNFEARFQDLVKYQKENGHYLNTAESVISKLRLRNSKSSSKEETQQSESDKSNFEARFQDLVKYQKENGHCLVPKKYPPNPSLSYFVFRMRYIYKQKQKSYLTQERINRLNKIGFSWWTKCTDAQMKFEAKRREPKRDSKWESFFDEFVQFQKKFGSSLIPKGRCFVRNMVIA